MIEILLTMLEFEHKLQDIVYGPGTLWFCFYIYRASSFYIMISNIYLSYRKETLSSGLKFVIAVEELEKAKPSAKKHTHCIGKSLFGKISARA